MVCRRVEEVLGVGRVPLFPDPATGREVPTEGWCYSAQGGACVSAPTEAGQMGANSPCKGWVTALSTAFHSETTAPYSQREYGIRPELC